MGKVGEVGVVGEVGEGEGAVRRRITKLLDNHIGLESTEALRALSELGAGAGEGAGAGGARRTLRHELERRTLRASQAVLRGSARLQEELEALHARLEATSGAVESVARRLSASRASTRQLIEQTSRLRTESRRVDKKLLFVEAFVRRFEISPAELETLHGPAKDAPITPEYFDALRRIEDAYADCNVLISSGFETSALDIMEKIGLHQEAAIERLYRWTLHACRNVDSPSNVLVSRALAKLQSRQVLFVNVVEEYCTSRKSTIVRQFIDALTRESDTGSKPIEFYANDPKRYIGDILTWVYQVIPVEKESLSMLLKSCNDIDKKEQIGNALMSILEAVCPPLKVRAELILKPDKDPVVLCSITNLIRYYKNTISETISGGQLMTTLDELLKQSEESFFISLDSKIQRELSHGVKAPPTNLTPSPIVTDLLGFLREVLSVINVTEERDHSNVKVIVSHILDPLLHAINETACHLSTTDMAVYLLNCIYHVQCTLSLYQHMDERNERLQAQCDAQIDTLTSEQASCLVANLNMGPIYTILQDQAKGPLSAIPGMDTVTLKTFLAKFDNFIALPEMYVLPQLGLLLSHSHKTSVQKRAFEVIIAIYKQLYTAVHDPVNNYSEPEQIMKRTSDEVEKLLSLSQIK